MLVQTDCESKFRGLREKKNLTKVWLTHMLFLLMSGDKIVQLIIYKVKDGNLECLHLALSWINLLSWIKGGVFMSLI